MKLSPVSSRPVQVAAVLSTLLVVALLLSPSTATEKKTSVAPSQLPLTVKKAVRKAFPKGVILQVETEIEGKDVGQFDVDVLSDGKQYEVEISQKGKVIETKEKPKKWTRNFRIKDCEFSSVGANPLFILKPGHRLVLQSDSEKVVITVLKKTVMVGGVETRVVEEREFEDGRLKEVSRNFFATCKKTGNVFYFGEEVDNYKNGKIVGHSGAWRADAKGSRAGIIMPGTILLGARHYQEIAPNAMDRAEILSDDVTLKTPAGTFKNCIRTEETSGLGPKDKCYKVYTPGIGLIQDEDLLLTEYSTGHE